jgi:hypothetical protein
MPAEASRLRRRVAPRDRRVVVLVATLAAAGVAAGAVLATRPGPPPPGCVAHDAAGVMGGGTWRVCGAAAQVSARP